MGITWDGITGADVLDDAQVASRHALADAARNGDWATMLDCIAKEHTLVNATRLGGQSLYTPLHQAAYNGAPKEVVTELLQLGAWRMLRDADGARPVEIAAQRGHRHLIDLLTPQPRRFVPAETPRDIQRHFHEMMLGRIAHLRVDALRLPELEPLLELDAQAGRIWFAVPGMYGGFDYALRTDGAAAVLVSKSWSRVVGGSGQRHEITAHGCTLVEEGFV
ncbi:ankyrin repeat domain-containing protein [Burkholderia sp. Se-20373]|uniref:ankyrin repeat domain-containing protein n=1 Tax=Burkholderia sp. Se-20373 TaxID=2703898 RepID=UPI00197D23F6|nr:ankyrin repeat domain-containing protein [Burkholderia sp. Se-20373]MBN3747772.1 ankyrin repeat domain-containing protein [Burkholderia sp. Se-20373]